jgi:hypothetical protein
VTTSTAPRRRVELGDPFSRHVQRVDQVATIAAPPKHWTELRDRFDRFFDLLETTPLRDKLAEAVVTGGTDEQITQLWGLALAEGAVGGRPDVVIAVRGEVYPRLVQLYSEVAAANYAKVAKEFDTVAGKFTTAAFAGNPEADANTLVSEPDPVRKGWLDAAVYAAELDRLTPVLQAAAELCGIDTRDDTWLLPLVINSAGLHRRRVWEAWRVEGGRCGHWAALAGLGAQIRAADLDGFEPHRTPKPLIHKQFPIPGPNNRGIYRTEVIDPEDEDYVPVEEPKRRKALAR